MKEALFWERLDGRVLCYLCPRNCKIGEGKTGFCFIRKNIEGKLYLLAYGKPCAVHVDPMEKKPLYHFLPGSNIISLGTAGCNLACKYCQNCDITKVRQEQVRTFNMPPEVVIKTAVENNCKSIAYTYNEPNIWGEYVMDISKLAREKGLKSVMVTNGYINIKPLHEIYKYIDAANVDLKSLTEEFYTSLTLSHLKPVLDAIVEMKSMGIWIEITNLVIPTMNDSSDELKKLSNWIYSNLGDDVPLHFSAFHPDFKLLNLPRTPAETLEKARKIAMDIGLKYVYEGNIYSEEGSNTYCPSCGRLLIRRNWHSINSNSLINGKCSCGQNISGYF